MASAALETGLDQAATVAAGPCAQLAAEHATVAKSRKRGAALEEAIHEGVFAELAEVGYAGFTIESVALRAQTGKTSIYRRWPTKQELVVDAFVAKFQKNTITGDDLIEGDEPTRDVMLELGRRLAVEFADSGEVFRAVACEVKRYPELADAIESEVNCHQRDALIAILQRGVDRGEVRPEACCATFVEVLPAVLMFRTILMNRAVGADEVADVVDRIVMPLLAPR